MRQVFVDIFRIVNSTVSAKAAAWFPPSPVILLPEHQGVIHALARAVELDEPSVVHDAVDDRRGELAASEHHAPFREFDIGRDDEAALLAAVAHDLEQESRAILVERDMAKFVDDEKLGFRDAFHELLEPMPPVRAGKRERQFGGGEEPRLQSRVDAGKADGYRQMRLAAPCLPAEDEVLRRADERKRLQAVDGTALRQSRLREVAPLEGLYPGKPRLPRQPLLPAALAHLHLVPDRPGHRCGLPCGCGPEERVDGVRGEMHRAHKGPRRRSVALLEAAHALRPLSEENGVVAGQVDRLVVGDRLRPRGDPRRADRHACPVGAPGGPARELDGLARRLPSGARRLVAQQPQLPFEPVSAEAVHPAADLFGQRRPNARAAPSCGL